MRGRGGRSSSSVGGRSGGGGGGVSSGRSSGGVSGGLRSVGGGGVSGRGGVGRRGGGGVGGRGGVFGLFSRLAAGGDGESGDGGAGDEQLTEHIGGHVLESPVRHFQRAPSGERIGDYDPLSEERKSLIHAPVITFFRV